MKRLFLTAFIALIVSTARAEPVQACSGDSFAALVRADLVFVGELIAVGRGQELGQPTNFMWVEVHRYLKGSGPSQLQFTENAANQCASGIDPQNVGQVAIFGVDRDERGRYVLPWFAVSSLQFESGILIRLAEAGVPPPSEAPVSQPPQQDTEAARVALLVLAAAALAAAARFATARYSVSTS